MNYKIIESFLKLLELKTLYPDTYFISFPELKALQLYLTYFFSDKRRKRKISGTQKSAWR